MSQVRFNLVADLLPVEADALQDDLVALAQRLGARLTRIEYEQGPEGHFRKTRTKTLVKR